MLADLMNVPSTDEDWQIWGLAHELIHQQMIEAIAAAGGGQLQQYQLYPFSTDRMDDFLERNQRAHADINELLNLNSTDLLEVDFEDERERAAWVKIHHQEHFDMAQRLGIQG